MENFSRNLLLCSSSVIGLYITFSAFNHFRRKWKKVGTVSQLFVYPLKSAAPIEVDHFYCKKFGPALFPNAGFDRSFFIVDEKGNTITAREKPKIVLFTIQYHQDHITITYNGSDCIDVPIPTKVDNNVVFCRLWKKDVIGVNCGDEIASWLSSILDQTCRLLYYPHFVVGHQSYQRTLMTADGSFVAAYQDVAPFNILSDASVDDLNSRLDTKITCRNFRPNILATGCGSFDEDSWKKVKINGIEFDNVMRTGRCLFTTIDPLTGTPSKDFEPLKTLRSFRKPTEEEKKSQGLSPLFGNHLATNMEGTISVGDDIYCLM